MIARIWKGVVRREDGDAYADYIRDTGFSEYGETAGNRRSPSSPAPAPASLLMRFRQTVVP
jgi:hypothetical protein